MTELVAWSFGRSIRPDLKQCVTDAMIKTYRDMNPGSMYIISGKRGYRVREESEKPLRDFLNDESEVARAKNAPSVRYSGPIYEGEADGVVFTLNTRACVKDFIDLAISENDRIFVENAGLRKKLAASPIALDEHIIEDLELKIATLSGDLSRKTASYKTVYGKLKSIQRRFDTAMRWLEIYEQAASDLREKGVKPKIRIPSGVDLSLGRRKAKTGRIESENKNKAKMREKYAAKIAAEKGREVRPYKRKGIAA